jgi:aspartyl protease family protein
MRSIYAALLVSLPVLPAAATDVDLIGVFPGKALLIVDGAPPKTYSVGQTITDGIKLISVSSSSAVIEENGKRDALTLGSYVHTASSNAGTSSVTLEADPQGHYVIQGQINGGTARMLLDTGATLIAMSASDARRFGIDYKKGQVGYASTANGVVTVYRVKLDTVKVGDIEVHQVDGAVQESGLGGMILLGNSFLNRMELRRDGSKLTLTKRY